MAEDLESFVKKLQSEGVNAGKEAAERLRKEAEQEAEAILVRARETADEIVQQAEAQAEGRRSRIEAELDMAVRDVILRLRASLGQALSALMTRRVREALRDPGYLREVIKDVVISYATVDATGKGGMEVQVSRDLPNDWIEDLLEDLSRHLKDPDAKTGVQAVLSRAGFDYRVKGAVVEVSPDSVTEVLLEMVNPELQEIIQKALKGEDT